MHLRVAVPVLVLVLVPVPGHSQAQPAARTADLYFEQTTTAYADGKPTGPGVLSRVWYGGRRMRMEAGGVAGGPALILRLDQGKAYRVDPAERTVTVIGAERLKTRTQMDAAMAGELMGATEDARVRTEELPGERTLAGYRCKGYRITAGPTVMDLWVTPQVPGGIDTFTSFLDWSGAADSLGPLLGEIRKLPGFPLQSRSRVSVMGETQETLATVTRVKVGPHPAGVFDPPPGYRVVEE
jgi:hypothetical protein